MPKDKPHPQSRRFCGRCGELKLVEHFLVGDSHNILKFCRSCRTKGAPVCLAKNPPPRRVLREMMDAEVAQRRYWKKTGCRSYGARDYWLKKLGYRSYDMYLRGSQWAGIRKAVLEEKGRDCFICGERAVHVHHTRYHKDDLVGNTFECLHPVCDKCHQELEFDEDGRKSSVQIAVERIEPLKDRVEAKRELPA